MSTRLYTAALVAAALAVPAVAIAEPLVANPTIISGSVLPPGGTILQTTDVDISLKIHDNELEFEIHDEPSDTEFAPHEALFYVAQAAAITRPAGTAFDFLGVAAGQDIFILPESPNADLPFVGWGTEEILPGSLVGGLLSIGLVSVSGGPDGSLPAPGVFSVFSNTDTGPLVRMSSSDGISSSDSLTLIEDSHVHFNLAFSAPGIYAVTLSATTTPIGSTTPLTAQATYYFGVTVIPEPAALGLLAPAATLLLRRRK